MSIVAAASPSSLLLGGTSERMQHSKSNVRQELQLDLLQLPSVEPLLSLASWLVNTVRDVFLCKVHLELSALEHSAVQIPEGTLCILLAVKLAEPKAFGLASLSIQDKPAARRRTNKPRHHTAP